MSETSDTGRGSRTLDFSVSADRRENGIGVVTICGEVDVYTSPRVRSLMLEQFDAGSTSLIVDLAKVDYLDSSGLGILVAGLKRAREHGGEIYLAGCKPRVLRVLEVTGLNRVFTMVSSVDEAVGKAGGA
jgi:anti-sigma B factor antagonist